MLRPNHYVLYDRLFQVYHHPCQDFFLCCLIKNHLNQQKSNTIIIEHREETKVPELNFNEPPKLPHKHMY